MKYIVGKVSFGSYEKEMMVVFPNPMVHDIVAATMNLAALNHNWKGVTWISAGEIGSDGECSGQSDSMGLKSRGAADTQLFHLQDYI